jgi:hypothetical protein
MTPNELSDKIEDVLYWQGAYANGSIVNALKEVVRLHQPTQKGKIAINQGCVYCQFGKECPTILAINRALKV